MLSGCNAAGLNNVQEFLSRRNEPQLFCTLDRATDAADFEQQLRALRPLPNSLTVYLVPPEVDWDVPWLRAAKRVLAKRANNWKMWSRVAFTATPDRLWQLLTDADESDLNDVDWIGLTPWDVTFLRKWLQDINLTARKDDAGTLLEISGGWAVELEPFSKKRASKSWRTRIQELKQETLRDPLSKLRDQFGLTADAERVFRELIRADDPFDDDSIQLVSGEIGLDYKEVRRRIVWGERLGLVSTTGKNCWTLNALVRGLLETSAPT